MENEKLRDVTPMLNINFVDTCLLCLQTGMSGNLIMLIAAGMFVWILRGVPPPDGTINSSGLPP